MGAEDQQLRSVLDKLIVAPLAREYKKDPKKGLFTEKLIQVLIEFAGGEKSMDLI